MAPRIEISSKEEALIIVDRLLRIVKDQRISFVPEDFPEQRRFIEDNSPLCAALCTRRAGKSYAVGLKLFKKAFEYPGATVLYLALTRDSAERIMWKDVLKQIAKEKGIVYKPNNTKLTMTLANGSVIKLAGADADEKEREKFLGGKYPYVAIDEAGSFSTDLKALVYEYLEPAVSDYDGSIDLIGTPTVFWQGFFCKVTEGEENGWKLHRWSTVNNPYMPNWEKRLRLLKDRDPRIEETPSYKRMYLGVWVKDDDARVYKFRSDINLINSIPDEKLKGQVLGIDLGFNDATAYSLACYFENNPNLYFVETKKIVGQILDDIVVTIKYFIETYDLHKIVIDNASKQLVESIKARFELYDVIIVAAEKTDKFEFIEFMNSDFQTSRIFLLKGTTKDLQIEYENLIKDPNAKRPTEHPSCDNHLCDASLYAWREARNYLEKPLARKLSEEDKIEQELEEAMERELQKDTQDELEMELSLGF